MDLNVAPDDEEEEERQESAVDTLRREREERISRMKRKRELEGPTATEVRSNGNGNATTTGRVLPQSHARDLENLRMKQLRLPDGWLDCPSMGEPIAGLIPSKVPLGDRFDELIPAGKRFSRSLLLRRQKANFREIGLVVDLTNSTRYYSPQEWVKGGVKYVKVACRGRDEVPEPEAVNRFVYEIIRFRDSAAAKTAASKRYILVHCTHGHNRTGFMIVHYLMRTQETSVEKCIELFAEARPPGIYKADYIESLYKFYHERRPEALSCPQTPEWKRKAEVDLNGEAILDDDGDDITKRGILSDFQEDVNGEPAGMTNDDVLGDAIPDEQQFEMQAYICQVLGVSSGRQAPRFPGSQPVSLDRKNLQLLRQRYFYATWKADGTRYMLFVIREGCYLIDRNFRFRRVQLRFPARKKSRDPPQAAPETHHLTLLDGEMVVDTVPGNTQSRRYLAYDLMILNSAPLNERPFHQRWSLINTEVIEPRSAEKHKSGRYMYEAENLSVRRKDFWLLSTTGKLLNGFIPKLPHEADGLILQGWDDRYVPRTHEGLLKWKYARMNSVDFLLQLLASGQYQLFLMERGGKFKQLDGARVTFPDGLDTSAMVGKIIECSWNPEENQWEFMRVRKDKETPNAWHVYEKVLGSLHDKITEEVLLREIEEICLLPLYVERDRAKAGQRR